MEDGLDINAVNPLDEMGAYEHMWLDEKATFKTIAERFRSVGKRLQQDTLPSELVGPAERMEALHNARKLLNERGVRQFGVRIHGTGDYPVALRDADHPLELVYYQGLWELINTPCVSVVGTRDVSEDGIRRTQRLVRELVSHGFTIVSGLAKGVDTVAHKTAIEAKGETIAVVGTPLGVAYPQENAELQELIARQYLLISQVPLLYYERLPFKAKRFMFPERNKTMSALSMATIIVEAGNTSGTLTQARAAIAQGRKLMILDSCFKNPELTWPKRFEQQGAVRIKSMSEVFHHLGTPETDNR
ncbi:MULTISPECIES: DNA-processing protein DprA [Henriciella]|jgi:DNA processing protein|uniref:DNA-processing protein DprA n=1 Tax=Henriciella TaxID=453849 RepID=UPI00351373FF